MIRLLPLALIVCACAGGPRYIRGSRVIDTADHREILKVMEKYRLAVERRDVNGLLAMASRRYWEDGGTPTGADDYGYDGLRQVLAARFPRATEIRYSLRYMNVKRHENLAYVDVLVNASFSIQTERGPMRMDMKDQNQLVLENDKGRWLFVSGM